jgi:hypothetical protein
LVGFKEIFEVHAAAALSSLSAPRATIFSASSGKRTLRSGFASSHGARIIQTSRSSSVVKITGTAFGSTTVFGAVVRKP